MSMYKLCDDVIMEGSRRLEIFFRPLSVAHNYYKNVQLIGKENPTEAIRYQDWLLEWKIPYIKGAIGDAIEEEFYNDREKRDEYMGKLEDDFGTFEFAIKGGLNELEFLQALGHQITKRQVPVIEIVEPWYAKTEPLCETGW